MTRSSDTEEAALDWLIRIDGGQLDVEEQAAFDQWWNASVRHQAKFLRLRHAWDKGNRLSQLRPLNAEIDEDLLEVKSFGQAIGRWWGLFSVRNSLLAAVSVAIVAGLALLLPRWDDYATAVGDSQSITLADGSRLVLNTGSHVRVSLRRKQRLLRVEQGEAYFKVAHDLDRPFVVRAGATTLRAVGTAFAVRRGQAGAVGVVVAQGSVAVNPAAAAAAGDLAIVKAESLLQAGDVATIATQGVSIAKLSEDQLDHQLAWMRGILWFDDQPLLDVAAEFNRYNRRQLLVADPTIAGLKIGGSFEATDLDSFIAALESLHVKAIKTLQSDGGEAVRLIGAATSQSM